MRASASVAETRVVELEYLSVQKESLVAQLDRRVQGSVEKMELLNFVSNKKAQEKYDLQQEVKPLRARLSGRLRSGVDKGVGMPAPLPPPVSIATGVQTDVSGVHVVHESTSASVVSQAGEVRTEVADVEMRDALDSPRVPRACGGSVAQALVILSAGLGCDHDLCEETEDWFLYCAGGALVVGVAAEVRKEDVLGGGVP